MVNPWEGWKSFFFQLELKPLKSILYVLKMRLWTLESNFLKITKKWIELLGISASREFVERINS